jgi:hypothetical protein
MTTACNTEKMSGKFNVVKNYAQKWNSKLRVMINYYLILIDRFAV